MSKQKANTRGLLKGVQKIIILYQKTISPDHGVFQALFPRGVCRYEPTCSSYTYQAVERYGWFGVIIGMKRVSRCHPFGGSGVDPVPGKVTIKNL